MNTKKIRKALENITKGKWEVNYIDEDHVEIIIADRFGKGSLPIGNAEFIANAPDYCRFLLAEIDRLKGALRETLDKEQKNDKKNKNRATNNMD